MVARLESVFRDVNDCLKFAEAKLLAILTFNSAWLAHYLKNIYDNKSDILNTVGIVFSSIPIIICIIGMIPKIMNNSPIEDHIKKGLKEKDINDNLLYYKDICKYSETEYYKAFLERIQDNQEDMMEIKYQKALIRQIVVLSKITYKKYYLVNICMCLTILPFIVVLIWSVALSIIG